MAEVARAICGHEVQWTIIRGKRTAFPTKELTTTMKVWHHFICARLAPIAHHSEVTKEQAFLLYDIAKNLSINVDRWIERNITYIAENTSLGIRHPTLITKLIVANGQDTIGDKVF